MNEPTGENRGKVPLKPFLKDVRSNLTDQELMRKYQLSAHAFVSLMKALFQKKYITPQDLARRKEINVKKDLARESQFLATLCICPNCGHPHPEPFDVCPACGAQMDDYHPAQEVLVSMSTIGVEVPVDELPKSPTVEPQEPEDSAQSVVLEGIEEVEVVEVIEEGAGPNKKPSAIDSVRSFLSKKLKRD
jgi:hypothetical protein